MSPGDVTCLVSPKLLESLECLQGNNCITQCSETHWFLCHLGCQWGWTLAVLSLPGTGHSSLVAVGSRLGSGLLSCCLNEDVLVWEEQTVAAIF